jgi:UDP-glucose 4-epimerase
VLVASCEKSARVLGWTPEVTRIEDIIATAWRAMHR